MGEKPECEFVSVCVASGLVVIVEKKRHGGERGGVTSSRS